jgi:hypothetical protein
LREEAAYAPVASINPAAPAAFNTVRRLIGPEHFSFILRFPSLFELALGQGTLRRRSHITPVIADISLAYGSDQKENWQDQLL